MTAALNMKTLFSWFFFHHSKQSKLNHFRFLFFSSENHQIIIRLHCRSVQNQYHIAAHEERCVNVDIRKVGRKKV